MKVVNIARKYIGEKEKPGNVFDHSTELGRELKSAGHKDGEAWCCYFAEAVFCQAHPYKVQELRKLFSASTVQTYHNFKENGYDVHSYPRVGDLVIFQRYKNGVKTWQGHAGIVSQVKSNGIFLAIEGNTNETGSREGTSVQEKTRDVNATPADGLRVLGFVTIL